MIGTTEYKNKYFKYLGKIIELYKMSGGNGCCICGKIIGIGRRCFIDGKKNHYVCDVDFEKVYNAEISKIIQNEGGWDELDLKCPCKDCENIFEIKFEEIQELKDKSTGKYGKQYLTDASCDNPVYDDIIQIISASKENVKCPHCNQSLADYGTLAGCLAVICPNPTCKKNFCGLCFGEKHQGRGEGHEQYLDCAEQITSSEKKTFYLTGNYARNQYESDSIILGWHALLSRMIIKRIFKEIRLLGITKNEVDRKNIVDCFKKAMNTVISNNMVPSGLQIRYLAKLRDIITSGLIWKMDYTMDEYSNICQNLNLIQALDTSICDPGKSPIKGNCTRVLRNLKTMVRNNKLTLSGSNTEDCKLIPGTIPHVEYLTFGETFSNGGSSIDRGVIPDSVTRLDLGGHKEYSFDFLESLNNSKALSLGNSDARNNPTNIMQKLPPNLIMLYFADAKQINISYESKVLKLPNKIKIIYLNNYQGSFNYPFPSTVKYVVMNLPSPPIEYIRLSNEEIEKKIEDNDIQIGSFVDPIDGDINDFINVIDDTFRIVAPKDKVFRNGNKPFATLDGTIVVGDNKKDISQLFKKNENIKNAIMRKYELVKRFVSNIINQILPDDESEAIEKLYDSLDDIIEDGHLTRDYVEYSDVYESLKQDLRDSNEIIYNEKQRMILMNYKI